MLTTLCYKYGKLDIISHCKDAQMEKDFCLLQQRKMALNTES